MILNPRARGRLSTRKVKRFLRGLGALNGLPAEQIATYAANAGFSGADLATAVAVALAESGGNPGAYNPEPTAKGGTPRGQGSYGLWQIYLRDHPEFAGANLYDPQTNANAAFAVYSAAGGFRPWSTYKYGQYRAYLSNQPSAVSPQPGQQPPLTIDAATGQVIDDPTPTPGDFSSLPAVPPVVLIGGAAVAAYFVFREMFD
jgi:hypothetical protein